VIAGDINAVEARKKVEHWFSDVKGGPKPAPLVVKPAEMSGVVKETMTDRVQLPRLYLSWHTPALYQPGDAELDVLSGVLGGSKNSRLYKRLVYELQLAQDVAAFQGSQRHGSRYTIIVTARPSADPPEKTMERIKQIVDEEIEKLRQAPPDAREVDRVKNGVEASFLSQMEVVSSKADQLNAYFFATGKPDYFATDLDRYRRVQPADVQAAVRRWLPADKRLELTVLPAGK